MVINLRLGLIIIGLIIGFLGWLISLTIIGALIGVPAMFLGGIILFAGLITSSQHQQIIMKQEVNSDQKIRIKIKCQKCKTLNSEDAQFCKHCGEKL
jgi:ribosomal protein L40E